MKILYVEDNPANLFLVKRVARVGGHDVVNYIDGEEALANFEKDSPDLVLMDIQLAGELSGLQVVERLRARGHKTPIIAVTAYAMIGDRERCLAAGCDDYIAKPLPIPRLVEILEKFSGQTGMLAPKPSDTQTARIVINTTPAPKKQVEDDTATNPTVAAETPKPESSTAPAVVAEPPKPETPAVVTETPKTETPAQPAVVAETPKPETQTAPAVVTPAPSPAPVAAQPVAQAVAPAVSTPVEVPALKLNTVAEVEDDETQVMPMINPLDGLDDTAQKEG